MRGFPRRLALLVAPVVLAAVLLGTAPTGAQEEPSSAGEGASGLTAEQVFTRIAAGFLLGVDLGDDPAAYEEVSMTLGTPLDSGLPWLQAWGQGVIPGPPGDSYAAVAGSPGVEVLSPGDAAWASGFDRTQFWAFRFDGSIDDLDGVGEIGVAFHDAGGREIADPTFPYSPLNGATRAVAMIFAGQIRQAVYSIASDAVVDVAASPYYVAQATTPAGQGLLLVMGPPGPAWYPYVSGVRGGDPADPELASRLAGWRGPQTEPPIEPTPLETVQQLLAENPDAAELAAFLRGIDPAAEPGAPADDGTPAPDDVTDEAEQAVDDVTDEAEQAVDDVTDEAGQAVDDVTAAADDTGDDSGGSSAAVVVIIGLFLLVLFPLLFFVVIPRVRRGGGGGPTRAGGAVAKAPAGSVHKRGAGGGYTQPIRPVIPTPDYEWNEQPPDPAIGTSGGGWVELGDAGPRAVVYRRVAEIAAAAGMEPNENGNVVPTPAMWERALDDVGSEGLPEQESLRADIRAGADPDGPRPEGVEPGSTIEVDGSTGRAFWRPPDGGPGPGSERVVPL